MTYISIADRPAWAFNLLGHRSRHMCLPSGNDWFVNRPYREQELVPAPKEWNLGGAYWRETGRMAQQFVCSIGGAA